MGFFDCGIGDYYRTSLSDFVDEIERSAESANSDARVLVMVAVDDTVTMGELTFLGKESDEP